MEEVQREPFELRTAVLLAILIHLILALGFERYALRTAAVAVAPEKEDKPLRFVFSEAPASEEPPPPETKRVAAKQHRASTAEPMPKPRDERSPPPMTLGGSPQMASLQQPPRPKPERKPEPRPTPVLSPDGLMKERLPEEPQEKSTERPTRVASLFNSEAIAQAVRQQAEYHEKPSWAPPTGVLDFDAKDFEWGPYAQKIYAIIKRNWYSVLKSQNIMPGVNGRTRINFRIQKSGEVLQLTVLAGSGWSMLDRSALASIELSNPLPPLPEAFKRQDVGVTFSYYYNMPVDPDY